MLPIGPWELIIILVIGLGIVIGLAALGVILLLAFRSNRAGKRDAEQSQSRETVEDNR